ncbi:hypothetical protein MKW92_030235 [Papaver armeniacum]|nr:hypothetical protein MKW92_030235 [Papaver armeniacum]
MFVYHLLKKFVQIVEALFSFSVHSNDPINHPTYLRKEVGCRETTQNNHDFLKNCRECSIIKLRRRLQLLVHCQVVVA